MATHNVYVSPAQEQQRREALQAYSRAAFQTTAGLAIAAFGIPLLIAGPIGALAMLGGLAMAVIGFAKTVDAARKARVTFGVIGGWLAPAVNALLDLTG